VLKAFLNNRWRTVGQNRKKKINVGQDKEKKTSKRSFELEKHVHL